MPKDFTLAIVDRYRVVPGKKLSIAQCPTREKKFKDIPKSTTKERIEQLRDRLDELQGIFYAQHQHKLLIILQAMDTGGKDGTIRSVFKGVNPQGVRVVSFKVPTPAELDHDYLWRVHSQVPGKGEMVVFNRSHYEDVLAVRVHHLVDAKIWSRRYDHINAFERMLTDEGTVILKFFFHIGKDEQRKRLQERLEDPKKNWKFRIGDPTERRLWHDYMQAYEDVLNRTSTPYAPWYVIPADEKLYRNLTVLSVLVQKLEELKLKYPPSEENLKGVSVK